MAENSTFDAYSPKEIAERMENVGVVKAHLPVVPMAGLGVLAGGFIGLGALFATLVSSQPELGFVANRILAGVAFSLGLILVVVGGAELFTGNNLLVMAWVARRITTGLYIRNLLIIFVTNFIGALGLAVLVVLANHGAMGGGIVGQNAVKIAAYKTSLSFGEAFFKGILCNILVCLAVWLAMGGRNVVDRIVAIMIPITAFVAAGFEHSVANMYFIPLGILLRDHVQTLGIAHLESLTWAGCFRNLLPVTLGNLVGGSVMVGLVYHIIYRRPTTS